MDNVVNVIRTMFLFFNWDDVKIPPIYDNASDTIPIFGEIDDICEEMDLIMEQHHHSHNKTNKTNG